jgi:hypothetical protein
MDRAHNTHYEPCLGLEEEHNDFQELGRSPYAVRKLDLCRPLSSGIHELAVTIHTWRGSRRDAGPEGRYQDLPSATCTGRFASKYSRPPSFDSLPHPPRG